jgi:hypothetical protein
MKNETKSDLKFFARFILYATAWNAVIFTAAFYLIQS